jgi:nucleotide-binding universal stress UspA family protein
MPGIVVGMDGSPNSEASLNWAMQEAAIRKAELIVLAVHPVAVSAWTGIPITFPADETALQRVRQAAEEAAQKASSQLGESQPATVTVRAVAGAAAQELINASRDADMIVVGARGGGGFARLAMGSVSGQVASHAACPVVIVPHNR